MAVFRGTDGDDKIGNTGGGNDVVRAGDGNDTVDGGYGDDKLYGEDGDDRLRGGAGNDRIYGGDGEDRIRGDDGDDVLYGDNPGDNGGLEGWADVFIFDGDDGNDQVHDFEVGLDKVELYDGPAGYALSYGASNTYLTYGSTTVVFYDATLTDADIYFA